MIEQAVKKTKVKLLTIGSVLIGYMVICALIIAKTGAAKSDCLIEVSQVVKSVQMLLTLLGIPIVFGLFSKKVKRLLNLSPVKEQVDGYIKISLFRIYIIAFLFVVNATIYLLLPSQSQLMLLTITTFIFFFIWPSVHRLSQDLELSSDNDTDVSGTEVN